MRRSLALTAATVVMLSPFLVACGEDTPEVCSAVDDLKKSVDQLKNIDVTETNGLNELKSQLENVDGHLAQVASDAESEFSPQVDAVATTFQALTTSVQAATDDSSADSLAAAGTAWSAFSTDVQTLITDVQSTC